MALIHAEMYDHRQFGRQLSPNHCPDILEMLSDKAIQSFIFTSHSRWLMDICSPQGKVTFFLPDLQKLV